MYLNLDELLERRAAALGAFTIPESTHHWQLVPFDDEGFVKGYGLQLKPEYRLLTYCNAMGGNCSSLLYAVPAGQPVETRPLPVSLDLNRPASEDPFVVWELVAGSDPRDFAPPRPTTALPDFMQAVSGPDEARAYLAAALLARDGPEIGASWHGCNWSTHRVLKESPFLVPERIQELLARLLEHLKESPLDPIDVFYRQHPDGHGLRDKYRKKLRQGKTPALTGLDLAAQIDWNQARLLEAVEWADCIYYNDSAYYGYATDRPQLPHELAQLRALPRSGFDEWRPLEKLPEQWLKVEETATEVRVTFFTYTGLYPERITRQVSVFQRGDFHPALSEHVVAEGPGGYIP